VTTPIDLRHPPEGHNYKVAIEKNEAKAEMYVRLGKDVALFCVGLTFVGLMTWLCIDTLRSEKAPPEEKRWAQSVLSIAVGGIIGYLVKK
jgi:hypothetical protein